MREDSVPDTGPIDSGRLAELAGEYLRAHYFVAVEGREWPLRIGRPADGIERQAIAGSYLFITAWNPASRILADAENRAAGERLRIRLQESGLSTFPARGCDASGNGVEHGYLALDAPPAIADALAGEFGQLGTLYWRRGGPVRLRMLVQRPPGFDAHPHVDWIPGFP